jgi:hypothetical protein
MSRSRPMGPEDSWGSGGGRGFVEMGCDIEVVVRSIVDVCKMSEAERGCGSVWSGWRKLGQEWSQSGVLKRSGGWAGKWSSAGADCRSWCSDGMRD